MKPMKAATDMLPASLLIMDVLPAAVRLVCVLVMNTCCTRYSHSSRAALRQLDSCGKLLLPLTKGKSVQTEASRRHSCQTQATQLSNTDDTAVKNRRHSCQTQATQLSKTGDTAVKHRRNSCQTQHFIDTSNLCAAAAAA